MMPDTEEPMPDVKTKTKTVVVTLRLDERLLEHIDKMAERRSRELYEDRAAEFRGDFARENRADTIRWLLELGLHHENRRQFAQWKDATFGKGRKKGGTR
jgi:hypothetical protein